MSVLREKAGAILNKDNGHPLYSYLTAIVFIVAMTIVIATGHAEDGNMLIVLGASTIPSILAAAFSERASRDIRNGTVVKKVEEALDNKQVVTRDGPVVTASLEGLHLLLTELKKNTKVTEENTESRNQEEGNGNGSTNH